MTESPRLLLTPGPHVRGGLTTQQIMWWVNLSLVPIFAWAVYLFGWRVVGLLISGVLGALVAEWGVHYLRRQRHTLIDGSAVLTGLLLVGTISPGMALWVPAVGGFMGILFAKMLFGGLGYNLFNPALIGRAVMMASFPVAMTTTWLKPQPGNVFAPDLITQATPLGVLKLEGASQVAAYTFGDLFFGMHAGSIGEVSVFLILMGAAMLVAKRIIKLYIPFSVVAGLLAIACVTGLPIFHLLTGGLWFGAFYMATDYVTAPMLPKAQMIFGLGVGLLTGVIRVWGGYPEGICYAILIMNTVTPALNHWFRPKRPPWKGAPS